MKPYRVYMIQADGETLGFLGVVHADDIAEARQVARREFGRYRFHIEL
jgi:hypothetical protein